ncbi:GAF and ANTAR domain-containing protein [Pseudarthrobacter phenanthrenivorans]|jgi:GAF domain-containing protein|uniref:Transcriptional regulator containing GAF, AAA-type ATPase, and DNA binding domains n=1 Tax=Pseudarthrobacter phenanthrenivorans (strain DSM 18606 / JCM 16027 / LMG 23796 / Sphe3) TaxID=930171 RepID=F0M413_PSEPM|nr:GAF and ANTAR domain-containing protein [Pseudarthrobacter phenanthrenivorans]ADX74500.1 transcriptional regulator containing GAF, AAA-type ATPase, and DNA binding domains [Pseudarthrobacter phenanthrenivorans Sphe3]TPV48216.1 GAF and ANTAR domain-containing protein [Pseudarthrobacter phenanthrenivorans]
MAQLPLDELSTVIARIQGLLLTEEKVTTAVRLLARAAKESVPGTIGAGVSLLDARGRRTSSGYTDAIVRQADAIQYEYGEGPCLTAWAAEETVLVRDLNDEARWPEWRNGVAGLPILSVVSAPLMAGGESIGSLKLYAAAAGVYDGSSADLLQLFAAPAATLLSHIQASEAPQKMTEGLQASLFTRDQVNRACGVLMERLGISHEAALQLLIRQARQENAALQYISERVIAGTPAPGT